MVSPWVDGVPYVLWYSSGADRRHTTTNLVRVSREEGKHDMKPQKERRARRERDDELDNPRASAELWRALE